MDQTPVKTTFIQDFNTILSLKDSLPYDLVTALSEQVDNLSGKEVLVLHQEVADVIRNAAGEMLDGKLQTLSFRLQVIFGLDVAVKLFYCGRKKSKLRSIYVMESGVS